MVMLLRKMFRDIWKNKTQFIAIFIMMFLGLFIFSGITSEYNGLDYYANKYMEDTNFPEAFVYQESFSEEQINALKKHKGITMIERRMVIPTSLQNDNKKEVTMHVMEQNTLARIITIEGQVFSTTNQGVWLDYLFAKENKYQVGNTIAIKYGSMVLEKEILGLVESPEYIYSVQENMMLPDHQNYGFVYTNASSLPNPQSIVYNQVLVETKKNTSKKVIREAIGENNTVLLSKDHPAVSMIRDEVAQHRSIGSVFSISFLIIATLISITTMHRMLQSQRMQIGILKAFGFTKRKLMIHFLSHTTFVCFVGSIVGYIIGSVIVPTLIYPMMKDMYVLPTLQPRAVEFSWVLPLLCTMVTMFISMIICHKYLKEKTTAILQGRQSITINKGVSKTTSKLPFRYAWNLRDISRNRLRAMMTILGVIGCTALLFAAFGLYDSMTTITTFAYHDLQRYECKVNLDTYNLEDIEYLKQMMNGQALLEQGIEIKYQDNKVEGSLTVIEDTKYSKLATAKDTYVELNDGMALSKNIADQLSIKTGDIVQYRILNTETWHSNIVTTIIRTPISQGITMLKEEYQKSGNKYFPTSVIGNQPNKDISKENIQSIQYKDKVMSSMNSVMEGMTLMIMVLLIGAIVLGSTILYNLGTLSYMERYRELASLKVLGFQNKEIKKILIQQNLWLASIGIVLGVFSGYGLIYFMVQTMPSTMDVLITVSLVSYLACILGTLLLTWVIGKCITKKVKRINMVEALKINE